MPEQGAAMMTAMASILGYENLQGKDVYTEQEIVDLMNQIKDPVGTFYMFSLPASILRRKVMKK
jgi:F420-non-reducing hydrogenase small subunit